MTVTSATGNREVLRGFTLIELLVALAIMVLIAAALPVALGHMLPGRRVMAAADQLVADLRWLQAEAIRARAPGQLTLLRHGYEMEVGNSHESVALAGSLQLQARARENERALEHLLFFPDGTALPARLSIKDSGRSVSLEIAMLTGRVQRVR